MSGDSTDVYVYRVELTLAKRASSSESNINEFWFGLHACFTVQQCCSIERYYVHGRMVECIELSGQGEKVLHHWRRRSNGSCWFFGFFSWFSGVLNPRALCKYADKIELFEVESERYWIRGWNTKSPNNKI